MCASRAMMSVVSLDGPGNASDVRRCISCSNCGSVSFALRRRDRNSIRYRSTRPLLPYQFLNHVVRISMTFSTVSSLSGVYSHRIFIAVSFRFNFRCASLSSSFHLLYWLAMLNCTLNPSNGVVPSYGLMQIVLCGLMVVVG